MNFNLKKLTNDASGFFTRAKQYTEETFLKAERTELDANFESLLGRADKTEEHTKKLLSCLENYLQPNPSVRMEEVLYEKLELKKEGNRFNNFEQLGHAMLDAATEFGHETPYGDALLKTSQTEVKLGNLEREFINSAANNTLLPIRRFLEGDMKTIQKERKVLNHKRLDLDAAKSRLKKAKSVEAQSTTGIGLTIEQAEADLRVAQTEFDKQVEITKLLLEGIQTARNNQLKCVKDFVECQMSFYAQAYQQMADLQRDLSRIDLKDFERKQPDEPFLCEVPLTGPPDKDVTVKIARVIMDFEATLEGEISLQMNEGTGPDKIIYPEVITGALSGGNPFDPNSFTQPPYNPNAYTQAPYKPEIRRPSPNMGQERIVEIPYIPRPARPMPQPLPVRPAPQPLPVHVPRPPPTSPPRNDYAINYCDTKEFPDALLETYNLKRYNYFIFNTTCNHVYFQCSIGQTFALQCLSSAQAYDDNIHTCNHKNAIKYCPEFDHILHCAIKDTCTQNEFACCAHPQKCIPISQRCNSIPDCGDGEDENNCPSCGKAQFACVKSGRCIDASKRCDGVKDDCKDGSNSDEEGCTKDTSCWGKFICDSAETVRVLGHAECISNEKICDGVRDCPGAEDETNCKANETKYLLCENQKESVARSKWCNGVAECSDGSDEKYC
uniref:BAR domain-containing protein n=1 Tax=Rhabditophanes sp. KR3021 TaxID=114890 RepID=A0AC35UFY8_9BILA